MREPSGRFGGGAEDSPSVELREALLSPAEAVSGRAADASGVGVAVGRDSPLLRGAGPSEEVLG